MSLIPSLYNNSCYGTVMVAAGLNWIAICYKSIREDVKWCTANGFIAVGHRKRWSTLSDSPTLPGLLVREGKFVRRSSTLTNSWRKIMVTNYWQVLRQGRVLQKQKLLGREHLSIVCSRQLIKSRPLQRHRTKSPQRTKQPITGAHLCNTQAEFVSAAPPCLIWKHSQQHCQWIK